MNSSSDAPASCENPNCEQLLRCDHALAQILATVVGLSDREYVSLRAAQGRVLARPVLAPRAVPFHANAAVDGFAVRNDDLPSGGGHAILHTVGAALAGHPYPGALRPGETVQIMTGAELPAATGAVLMQEHVEVLNDTIRIEARHRPGDNIRSAGEDLAEGATALPTGRRLDPACVGVIAALGLTEVEVIRRVRVAVLSTGDEVLEPGDNFQAGKLYDSNRYGLMAALERSGAQVLDLGVIGDELTALRATLHRAVGADLVISTGGVSVGTADYTRSALAELGRIAFWKVAIKPGRPLAFGLLRDTPFFGLPGNPVAAQVAFYQFVLPALRKRMGEATAPPPLTFNVRTEEKLRKKPGRTEFQRGIFTVGGDGSMTVRTTGKQGAGVLTSVTEANCFIVLDHERDTVHPGESVAIQPFSAFWP